MQSQARLIYQRSLEKTSVLSKAARRKTSLMLWGAWKRSCSEMLSGCLSRFKGNETNKMHPAISAASLSLSFCMSSTSCDRMASRVVPGRWNQSANTISPESRRWVVSHRRALKLTRRLPSSIFHLVGCDLFVQLGKYSCLSFNRISLLHSPALSGFDRFTHKHITSGQITYLRRCSALMTCQAHCSCRCQSSLFLILWTPCMSMTLYRHIISCTVNQNPIRNLNYSPVL